MTTISSWIKETILMCYDLANSEDLVLVRVKAHQVRALVDPRAFYNNASVVYSFYLKNLSQYYSSGYRVLL